MLASKSALRPSLPAVIHKPVRPRVLKGSRIHAKTPTESDRDKLADLNESTEKVVTDLKQKWDDVEEKPAAIGITVSVFIALYALNGVINAVDSIPIVSGILELIGLFVTAWFVYRYLIFGPDREELKQNFDSFWAKVSGKKA